MKREIDYDDLMGVLLDIQGIEALLVHLETSEYLKLTEEDGVLDSSFSLLRMLNVAIIVITRVTYRVWGCFNGINELS